MPQPTPLYFYLENYWSVQAFVIEAQSGDEVSFSVRSRFDVVHVEIVDASGFSLAEADENEWGTESITATLDGTVPFLLLVEQFSEDRARVTVEGDAALMPLSEPDDGVILEVPAKRASAIDFAYDVDQYLLPLDAGETVRIRVDSTQIDSFIRIDYRDSPDVTEDDDSGGGLFGVDAELVYHAEDDRTYRVVIDDPSGETGGYTLTIEADDRASDQP